MKNAIVYICITALCFATMESVLKLAQPNLGSMQITCIRFLLGGAVLLPFAYFERKKSNYKLVPKDFLWMLLLGSLCVPGSMYLFQMGIERCNAATAAILICTSTMFTMLLAAILAGEKMNKIKWTSLAIGTAAMVFMIRPWNMQEGNTVLGVSLTVIAAITFSVYTVIGKKSMIKMGVMTQTSISFILGAGVMAVMMLFKGESLVAGVMDNIPLLLYLGILVTGFAYWSFFTAIKKSDASTASITFYIKPAIAPICAMLIAGETIEFNTNIGVLLLITASVVNMFDSRPTLWWRRRRK